MIGRDTCWNHSSDPVTNKFPEPAPIDRPKEIRLLEKQLRSCYRLPSTLERAKVVMQLIELLERLRKPEPAPKDLTVEERLALRR